MEIRFYNEKPKFELVESVLRTGPKKTDLRRRCYFPIKGPFVGNIVGEITKFPTEQFRLHNISAATETTTKATSEIDNHTEAPTISNGP